MPARGRRPDRRVIEVGGFHELAPDGQHDRAGEDDLVSARPAAESIGRLVVVVAVDGRAAPAVEHVVATPAYKQVPAVAAHQPVPPVVAGEHVVALRPGQVLDPDLPVALTVARRQPVTEVGMDPAARALVPGRGVTPSAAFDHVAASRRGIAIAVKEVVSAASTQEVVASTAAQLTRVAAANEHVPARAAAEGNAAVPG